MMIPTHRAVLGLLAVGVLIALNGFIWYAVCTHSRGQMVLAFLDVGQGDSIYVRSPDGYDMLIDGGPDHAAVRELPNVMGPLDRTIDLVVETHPDKDHIAGLVDVLARYQVRTVMTPGVANDTDTFRALEHAIASEPQVTRVTARRGMRIHLGSAVYADVLYPDHDVSRIRATNDASITLHLVYGSTTAMLTGDLPSTIEDILVRDYGTALQGDILKAGHHGSKYSTDALWLRAVHPRVVVISAGAHNTYGHPSPDVLERVRDAGADIVSTIDRGTIIYESDGTHMYERR